MLCCSLTHRRRRKKSSTHNDTTLPPWVLLYCILLEKNRKITAYNTIVPIAKHNIIRNDSYSICLPVLTQVMRKSEALIVKTGVIRKQ